MQYGLITLQTAITVDCWDEIYAVGSLKIGLLDRRKHAQISTIDQLSCNTIRPLFLLQQTTDKAARGQRAHRPWRFGGEEENSGADQPFWRASGSGGGFLSGSGVGSDNHAGG